MITIIIIGIAIIVAAVVSVGITLFFEHFLQKKPSPPIVPIEQGYPHHNRRTERCPVCDKYVSVDLTLVLKPYPHFKCICIKGDFNIGCGYEWTCDINEEVRFSEELFKNNKEFSIQISELKEENKKLKEDIKRLSELNIVYGESNNFRSTLKVK